MGDDAYLKRSESRPLKRTGSRASKMSCCWPLLVVRHLMYRSPSGEQQQQKEHTRVVYAVARSPSCLHVRGSCFASIDTRVYLLLSVSCHGRAKEILLGQSSRWQQKDRKLAAKCCSQKDSKSKRDDSSRGASTEDRDQCACRSVRLPSDHVWQIYMEPSRADKACQMCRNCVCSIQVTIKAALGQYHTQGN